MKVAVITDTHWGARGDSPQFSKYMGKFYEDVFFPYLKLNGITTILHCGDIFDRRKYVNYLTLRNFRTQFLDPISNNGYKLHAIIGNHDTFFKHTNEINSMQELLGEHNTCAVKAACGHGIQNIRWYSGPTEIVLGDTNILLVPWICTDNYDESLEAIAKTKAQVCFGHLELASFEMYKGTVVDTGFDPRTFEKFEIVGSGHFHHKSTRGNINYLGAPYEMTWSDYNDERGFHVFDTETRQLTFIQNPYRLFHKVIYNDEGKNMLEVVDQPIEHLKDTYIKIVIQNKTNPYWLDLLVERIEKQGCIDLQIVEDHLNLDLESDSDIVDEAEDTLTIMKRYGAQYLGSDDPARVQELHMLLGSLYSEALTVERQRSSE